MPFRSDRDKRKHNQRYYQRVLKSQREATGRVRDGRIRRKKLVAFRLDEALVARAQQLRDEAITTGKFPSLKSMSRVWEELIIRGFTTLKHDMPAADDTSAYIEAIRHADAMRVVRLEAQHTLGRLQDEIDALLEIGATNEAVGLLQSSLDNIQQMPATRWREWLLKQLQKAYPQLFDQKVQGVSVRASHKKLLTFARERS